MTSQTLIERLERRVDPSRGDPLSHQLVEGIWMEVVEGTLPIGERLPTARQLSVALGIGPRNVERAYRTLERLGVTVSRAGEGTFVSLDPPPEEERRRREELAVVARGALERTFELDLTLDDLLEALAEYRSAPWDATSASPADRARSRGAARGPETPEP